MDIHAAKNAMREGLKKAALFFEQAPLHARTHWKPIVAIVAGVFVLSLGLLAYALYANTPAPATTDTETETEEMIDARERALDGVLVHPSSTRLLPLGVMVENSTEAWPLQGPAKAQLVFEAPVEGSITRLLLLFDASSTVAEIGPVRSARPYYVEWADGLEAFYGHVGGSPEGLDRITSLAGFRDLNEFYNGWVFWRASNRVAPHNVMTRTDLLLQAVERKEYVAGSFKPWTYTNEALPEQAEVSSLHVPYEGSYAADWEYDATTGLYTRHYRTGETVRDADGTAVTATNVVVLLTDASVVDDVGRLRVRTTGSGRALVANGGQLREATWSRTSGNHLVFTTVDGADVPFRRGTTWISVVTKEAQLEKVHPEEE
jgi:hypothetical protein